MSSPADPHGREALHTLLRHHRRVVLKPAVGANSRGVLYLSADGPAPTATEAQLTRAAAPATPATPATPAAPQSSAGGDAGDGARADSGGEGGEPLMVWVGSPVKQWRCSTSVDCAPFAQFWRERVERSRSAGSGGTNSERERKPLPHAMSLASHGG